MVVDNCAVAYEMAMDEACRKYGFEHPGGMNDYGASWAKVKKEFSEPFRKLLNSSYGFGVICHEKEVEIETRGGRKFMKMKPDWPRQADEFLGAYTENIFYYYYEGSQRWLQIDGDEYVTAKCKINKHFLTPAGERVARIPMGKNLEEGYNNLMLAFNNKQKETFAHVNKYFESTEGAKSEGTEKAKPIFKKK